ncbi:hypothetical protein BON30_37615 [Cystobacter ferrugineus]|uniref:DUF2306 domain-containing protein n=2 Tax=Cystobacter ferrugineus TaxID=83449 RepID=A0A1L9B0J2_9BACT|nr:hypothetical protein BON30_37615 [Cystobacter ferrugineus]
MSSSMSTLGIVHTVISVVPLVLGVLAFARDGQIDPRNRIGKLYIATMVASIVTSFGLSSRDGFNPGHALGLLALGLMLAGAVAGKIRGLGRALPYVRTLTFSASFLLLLVPGVNETLTRLPVGQPLASGPESPLVQRSLLGLLLLFLLGSSYQVFKLRGSERAA